MNNTLISKTIACLGGLALIASIESCAPVSVKPTNPASSKYIMKDNKYSAMIKAAPEGSEVPVGDGYWSKDPEGWTKHSKNDSEEIGEDSEVPLEILQAVENGASIYEEGIPENTPVMNLDR